MNTWDKPAEDTAQILNDVITLLNAIQANDSLFDQIKLLHKLDCDSDEHPGLFEMIIDAVEGLKTHPFISNG